MTAGQTLPDVIETGEPCDPAVAAVVDELRRANDRPWASPSRANLDRLLTGLQADPGQASERLWQQDLKDR